MPIKPCGEDGRTRNHPCFSKAAHHRYGRVHMPVAPACNIQCRFCVRKYDCANESRPGVSSRVLTAREALGRVRAVVGRDGRVSVVGVAGPGDPLANQATYELLGLVHDEFPEVSLCLSTNGLLLPDKLDELVNLGLDTLTVTINAIYPRTAEDIYAWVKYEGRIFRGAEAASLLVANQWLGLRAAVESGLAVKVNTICIPGVNDREIPYIAERVGGMGAAIMNVMPLIPQGEFSGLGRPGAREITEVRAACMPHVSMMTHCRQCRADAAGLLGEDRDMETEALMARIGEEYEDMVAV